MFVSTICGVCGLRGKCEPAVLKAAGCLRCAGCGRDVKPNQYELVGLVNANERTPRQIVTLYPAIVASSVTEPVEAMAALT
jgi:hypothetical protein